MQTFPVNEAKTQFGQIIDLAQRELYANRLQHTLLEPAPLASLQIISAQQAFAVLGI